MNDHILEMFKHDAEVNLGFEHPPEEYEAYGVTILIRKYNVRNIDWLQMFFYLPDRFDPSFDVYNFEGFKINDDGACSWESLSLTHQVERLNRYFHNYLSTVINGYGLRYQYYNIPIFVLYEYQGDVYSYFRLNHTINDEIVDVTEHHNMYRLVRGSRKLDPNENTNVNYKVIQTRTIPFTNIIKKYRDNIASTEEGMSSYYHSSKYVH